MVRDGAKKYLLGKGLRLLDRVLYTIDGLWGRRGRRTLAATRLGQLAKRRRQDAIRRALAPRRPPPAVVSRYEPAAPRAGAVDDAVPAGGPTPQHVLLISHCDFTSP